VLASAGPLAANAAGAIRHHHAGQHAHRACSNADSRANRIGTAAVRAAVVCLINRERAAHGLPRLRESSLLDRAAQIWTDTMVATGDFTHGSNPGGRLLAVGFAWLATGENIATGFQTPQQAVSAWMASRDHCRNILSPLYTEVGTGISWNAVGSYASGPATWTQDFALPLRLLAPSQNWGPANDCPY
jgi:uncharacterized protein YkwD